MTVCRPLHCLHVALQALFGAVHLPALASLAMHSFVE